jgi:hypothetical protein
MEKEFVSIKKEDLQKLIDNFYRLHSISDEMHLYIFEGVNHLMNEMKSWTDEKFGREIDKENYD